MSSVIKKHSSESIPRKKDQPAKSPVIKGQGIENKETVRIISEKGQVLKKSSAEVEPIVENDMIVGIIHRCTCGKRTEIRFEFEE